MKEKRVSRDPAPPHSVPCRSNSGSGFLCPLFYHGCSFQPSRTSFRVVLERFPNHHGPRLPLPYFTSEAKFSSSRKTESGFFPGRAVVKNPPVNAGTQACSLVWEDPTCHRARKPVCPTPEVCTPWSGCSTAREAATVRSQAPQ